MERLTLEEIEDVIDEAGGREIGKNILIPNGRLVREKLYSRAFAEVIEYKKIEEELGCPMDIVFRALKQGYIYANVYTEDETIKWQITHFTRYEGFSKDFGYVLQTINGVKCGLGRNGYNQYIHLDCEIFMLKEYKKTWWLNEDKSE